MTTVIDEEWRNEVRSTLCNPHGLKEEEESHVFCYWKKRWAGKHNWSLLHIHFLNPQMLLSIQRKLFFLMTLLLNGKMNPGDPLSTPLSSLCSASILIKSWAHIPSFFADPLPVSSQLTTDKKSFSLTCLGVHHIQFWEKITKSKEKKPSFPTPPQHITVIYVDYISFSRRV